MQLTDNQYLYVGTMEKRAACRQGFYAREEEQILKENYGPPS